MEPSTLSSNLANGAEGTSTPPLENTVRISACAVECKEGEVVSYVMEADTTVNGVPEEARLTGTWNKKLTWGALLSVTSGTPRLC